MILKKKNNYVVPHGVSPCLLLKHPNLQLFIHYLIFHIPNGNGVMYHIYRYMTEHFLIINIFTNREIIIDTVMLKCTILIFFLK